MNLEKQEVQQISYVDNFQMFENNLRTSVSLDKSKKDKVKRELVLQLKQHISCNYTNKLLSLKT
jgi:hypothetical protein